MSSLGKGIFAGLSLLYPFAIYFGAQTFSPRYLVLVLLCLALLRWFGSTPFPGWLQAVWLGLVALLAAFSLWADSLLGLLVYPVAINLSLLLLFGASLLQEQTLVERLARLQDPNLPVAAIAYTRKVTWVWCGFFLFNGSMAALTVWWGDQELWLLYNGFVAYVLMGLLALVEYLVRLRHQRRHARGVTDVATQPAPTGDTGRPKP
ncbi:hypothetical protein L1F30_04035 [Simiduia sp. 21SJ11W-1]|uniref:COG4648 family protein n=1 Tax=Simiduia sp. 21SJ11W-1 TaxID=2909669 RepID=UPI00209D5CC9|nr:hypothetical protein [Simiduia sp. 21SJ11W-1]UTA48717.1 hypothetical protein L1F30_04035 [Simiduia sp. 21SJ11W-1]